MLLLPFSPRIGFDGPVVCTDCLEGGNGYSKDPDYVPHGLRPPDLDYQQNHRTMEYRPRGDDLGPVSAPHCNGTPNGLKREIQAPVFPSNHNRVTSPKRHCDRKGGNGLNSKRAQLYSRLSLVESNRASDKSC